MVAANTMGAVTVRFITRKWPPAIGGMETYSVRLAAELAKRLPVDLMALPGRPSGREPTRLSLLLFGIKSAVRLLWSSEAWVVHAGDIAVWPLAWIASLRHPRSRIVLSAHGSDVRLAFRTGWRPWLYRLYLKAGAGLLGKARIIANSEYIAGLARRTGFRNVRVVPLATDFSFEENLPRRDLLYGGRISRAKGLRFVVEQVLPQLPKTVRLRVAGTLWEESERGLLLHAQVDYLGSLPPAELASELGRAAAVLIPTRESEGFGLVAIEAAACGAIVISSNHSGLAEVVREPIGVAVDANDAAAWAAAISTVLAMSEEQRHRCSAAARAHVDRLFRWPRVAQETLAAYELP